MDRDSDKDGNNVEGFSLRFTPYTEKEGRELLLAYLPCDKIRTKRYFRLLLERFGKTFKD